MSTIVQATNLPSSISSAAGTVSFSSVLAIPALVVNRLIKIRASGSIALPPGTYQGSVSASIGTQTSPVANLIGSSTSFSVEGPGSILPFVFSANVYGDPFIGSFLDVLAPASVLAKTGLAFDQSGAVIGASNNNVGCAAIGGGILTFASATNLIVQAIFANNPNSATPLPTLQATLAKFDLEY